MFDASDVYLYKWNELNYLELEIEIGVVAFRMLIENQENSLLEIERKFNEKLKNDEEHNSLDDSLKGSYYSAFYEREQLAINDLRRKQRYSICLSIFSFFEGRLKSLCDQIENEFNFMIKLDDLNGNDDIKRYWSYLVKVFNIDTDTVQDLMQPIIQQKATRNIIAHQEGLLTSEKLNKIVRLDGLVVNKIGDSYQLKIDNVKYLLFLIEKIESFFIELLRKVDGRYGILKEL